MAGWLGLFVLPLWRLHCKLTTMNIKDNMEEWNRIPFPKEEDAYTFEDYSEDCTHFATLGRTGVELRSVANDYFRAHYPPADRAQRCLNLFWSIETFLSRRARESDVPIQGNSVQRFEEGTKAAWDYYSGLKYGDVVTDDIAIVETANILLKNERSS